MAATTGPKMVASKPGPMTQLSQKINAAVSKEKGNVENKDTKKTAATRKGKKGFVLYLDPDFIAELRLLALQRREDIQVLSFKALNRVLIEDGCTKFAE
jgi:hypothetical protein